MATLNQTIRDAGATSNVLTAEQAEFYSKTLLARLVPELKFTKFASMPNSMSIPRNAGDKISFRKVNSLTKISSALTEGVTPEGANLSITKIDATVAQYGNYVVITDLADAAALDRLKVEAVEVLGENAAESIEGIVATTIFGGTSVYQAGGVATRLLTNTTITYADILNTKAMLRNNNVKPINGEYIMFVPNKVANDLMQLTEWKEVNYNNHDGVYSGDLGKLAGVRFIEISDAYKTMYAGAGATGKNVYASLMIGADFFGIPDIAGSAKPEIIIQPPTDPLHQRYSCGWKACFTVKRINEYCGVRLETC